MYLRYLGSLRLLTLSLLAKMFQRACRQKQPEQRLFLLSVSVALKFFSYQSLVIIGIRRRRRSRRRRSAAPAVQVISGNDRQRRLLTLEVGVMVVADAAAAVATLQ